MKKKIMSFLPWVSEDKKNCSKCKYDFEVNGLYFDLLSINELTCRLTKGEKRYSGYVTIPETIEYNGKTLHIVDLGNSVHGNGTITGITIPSSINELCNNNFLFCYKLNKLVINESKNPLFISRNLLNQCPVKSLFCGRDIYWEEEYAGESPFYEKKKLTEVEFGNSVTSVNDFTFKNCISLSKVTFSNRIVTIGDEAFYGCTGLNKVTIPDSVKEIGNSVFCRCSKLSDVTLGTSVSHLGSFVFDQCAELRSIISLNPIPPKTDEHTFVNKNYIDTVVYIPNGSLQAYKNAPGWSNFWNIKEVSV